VFDIVSFCHDYGIDYALKGKNIGKGWIGLQCPYHLDNDYHLGFNVDGAYFYCWKCGGHKLVDAIKEMTRCSTHEALMIQERYGDRNTFLNKLNRTVAKLESIQMPGEPLTKPYRIYLHNRNFYPDEIEAKYRIKAGGIVGEWKYRIMIPVYNKGVLITYQGRDITGNSDLRYKTLSLEKSLDDPKKYLYNLDNAKGKEVIVCEGVTDVWRIGDGSVATLGTSTTEEQVRKLSKYRKIYILFDPEENAQKRAKKLGERIAAMGSEVEIIDTGLDHDPGDMTEAEVSVLRKELGILSGV
jgi:hypothetical protein